MSPWRPALLLALAAIAGHAAWVLSRLVHGPPPTAAWVVAVVPLVLWLVGMLRRSPVTLLGLVPVSWALPAYLDDPRAFASSTGLAAVCTLVAYVVAATAYLRPARRDVPSPVVVSWQPLTGAQIGGAQSGAQIGGAQIGGASMADATRPALAAALVVGPGLGVLLMPGLEGTLRQGFGPLAGLVGAGLVVLGTLLGLAFATDVHRHRPARSGSVARGRTLGVVAMVALVAALWLR